MSRAATIGAVALIPVAAGCFGGSAPASAFLIVQADPARSAAQIAGG